MVQETNILFVVPYNYYIALFGVSSVWVDSRATGTNTGQGGGAYFSKEHILNFKRGSSPYYFPNFFEPFPNFY